MSLLLEREAIEHFTEDLEVTIAGHLAWFRQINRVFVFSLPVSQAETAEDAHLRTAFGQWYYRRDTQFLAENPEFLELGRVQLEMHAAARAALKEVREGRRPGPADYDRCIELALRLNTALRKLQLDIIGDLLSTDSLTGCSTRRGMLGKLRVEHDRAQRIQRPCCIGLMDFDRFKRINDELGHPAGDAVLSQGMRFVTTALRKYDTLYRYGGEEFLLCLPGSPLREAAQVVERIREGLANLPIRLPNGQQIQATASFGLAEMQARAAVEETIANADMALIQAKENGRNRVEVWSE
ncbi:MAG: diguanylate cyclase [Betaproteobacteria bacterium]|nr:diguanylate cyclase [Betaproteobacteria bacterium]